MNLIDWVVIGAGALGLVWVYWYFFAANRAEISAVSVQGIQEVGITVQGGYDPATVRAKAGAPLTLVFDRQETSSCSDEVVFGDYGVRQFLPAFQKTSVSLPAKPAGTYEFTCGMGMLRGKVIVE